MNNFFLQHIYFIKEKLSEKKLTKILADTLAMIEKEKQLPHSQQQETFFLQTLTSVFETNL